MKNFKTLAVVVVCLILINIALMACLWYSNYRKPRPVQGNAFAYLSKQLQLTPNQVKQYDVMRQNHFAFTSRTGAEQRMLRDSFFNYLKDTAADPQKIADLEKRILLKQQQLDSATFYHFRSFRAILNSGQQLKFDSLIQDVLHMMGQPRPQRAPGNQPPMGPPPGDGPPPEGPPPGGPPR